LPLLTSHREYCGAEPPATPAHVHSEMPAPGVQDFRLIAPLQFMSYHARASLTRASISAAKESA
jgi:hypothetical protein